MTSGEFLADLERRTNALRLSEPSELAKLRSGVVSTDAGTYGQWFSIYHDIHHDVRWFAAHAFPTLAHAAESGAFAVDELVAVASRLIGSRMDFLTWLGVVDFCQLVDAYVDVLGSLATVAEFAECTRRLQSYTALLLVWTTHYYPWGAVGLLPAMASGTRGIVGSTIGDAGL